MRHRLLRVMAAMSASTLQAPLEGEREGVFQLRTQGLGVTEAALDVFSNFVQHIATNAEPTSVAADKQLPSKPQLRWSKRLVHCSDAPIAYPPPLATLYPTQVRLLACLPCVLGSRLGFRPPVGGHRRPPPPPAGATANGGSSLHKGT
jgi:hypothetical protein